MSGAARPDQDAAGMRRPLLELRGVGKSFGGLKVIDDLSFKVMQAERVALIGPNGAGKTSAFNLVSGLYAVDAGSVMLDDADITRVPSRKRVGYGLARTFQNIRLMAQLTVLENVMLGQSAAASSFAGMLQPVNLLHSNRWREQARAELAAAGLSQYEKFAGGELPYGIQKRVELVRALLARPRMLLLDEPAAGLNPTETNAMRAHLERIAEAGATLLVVEHDMHFVGALCHRVLVLNFGRLIADCTPREAQADPRVREAYLGADDDLARRHAA